MGTSYLGVSWTLYSSAKQPKLCISPNKLCMDKICILMLSFVEKQGNITTQKKSNLTSLQIHTEHCLSSQRITVRSPAGEGQYLKNTNPEPGLETLCTHKAVFVGILNFVKKLLMNCKDNDGLPFFFFPVIIIPSFALKRGPREFAESCHGPYNAHYRGKLQGRCGT